MPKEIEAIAEFGGQVNYTQSDAFILYSSDGNGSSFLLRHPITVRADGPELGPGELLGREALYRILRKADGLSTRRYLLPDNVLCWDTGVIAWWTPSRVRRMLFKTMSKEFNRDMSDKEYLQPPLLFRADSHGLAVWAMQHDRRPTRETPLYFAPFFNVYREGRVCRGSAPMPASPTPKNTEGYEKGFYESFFTHQSIEEITTHPKGHTGWWKDMRRRKVWRPEYAKHLRPVLLHLEDVVNEARGRG